MSQPDTTHTPLDLQAALDQLIPAWTREPGQRGALTKAQEAERDLTTAHRAIVQGLLEEIAALKGQVSEAAGLQETIDELTAQIGALRTGMESRHLLWRDWPLLLRVATQIAAAAGPIDQLSTSSQGGILVDYRIGSARVTHDANAGTVECEVPGQEKCSVAVGVDELSNASVHALAAWFDAQHPEPEQVPPPAASELILRVGSDDGEGGLAQLINGLGIALAAAAARVGSNQE